ncbi:transcriptional regulator, LacI family [Cohaesibacter gelatinilyticus]|uniref:Transcriptional regulator, LacI family n=1 Tax=Cohaesibacter gelatinilyticus TaxID=372072 RepID=A0A285PFY2_9HYPH|nr:transcriptional regulator, LacI family [Cohaesibacter gelatinilyticus]
MKSKVTIKDVAQKAGCGVATVSRVLNGTGSTSEKTRKKVLAAAEDLGFVFSDIGRSLQSSTTRTIGCIVPSLANPIFADAVQGIQEEVQKQGYQLLLACSKYDAEEEQNVTRLLIAKQVDGIILTVNDTGTSKALDMIRDRGIPACLMFNRSVSDFPASGIDNFAAAHRVAQALHAEGHHHTGFLALNFQSSDRSRERFMGFQKGCQSFGMAEPVLLQIEEQSGDLSLLLHELLAAHGGLTGIFASNDFLAIAAIREAKSLGRQVPQHLSIVGFDGIEIGRMVDPSLATIETNARQMGCMAARHVLARLVNDAKSDTLKLIEPDQKALRLPYHFRSGGSLAPPEVKTTDGEEAATSSPSCHPTPSISS